MVITPTIRQPTPECFLTIQADNLKAFLNDLSCFSHADFRQMLLSFLCGNLQNYVNVLRH